MKNGNYQLTMLDHFSKPIYNRRKFMKMVISVPRRVFNDKNYSKTNRQINKETKLKHLLSSHKNKNIDFSGDFVCVPSFQAPILLE